MTKILLCPEAQEKKRRVKKNRIGTFSEYSPIIY